MDQFQERLLEILSSIEDELQKRNTLLETQNALLYEDLCRKYPEPQPQEDLPTVVGSNPQLAEILKRQRNRG